MLRSSVAALKGWNSSFLLTPQPPPSRRCFRSEAALDALRSHSRTGTAAARSHLVLYNYPSFSGAFAALFAHLFHSHLGLPFLVLPFSSSTLKRISRVGEGLDNLELRIDTKKSSARAAYDFFSEKLFQMKSSQQRSCWERLLKSNWEEDYMASAWPIGAVVFMQRRNLKMCLRSTDCRTDTSEIAKLHLEVVSITFDLGILAVDLLPCERSHGRLDASPEAYLGRRSHMFRRMRYLIGLNPKTPPARLHDARPRRVKFQPPDMLETVHEIAIYIHRRGYWTIRVGKRDGSVLGVLGRRISCIPGTLRLVSIPSVAVHEFKIPPRALLGLHSYCPVHFDAFHAVLVDLSVHIVYLKAGANTREKLSRFVRFFSLFFFLPQLIPLEIGQQRSKSIVTSRFQVAMGRKQPQSVVTSDSERTGTYRSYRAVRFKNIDLGFIQVWPYRSIPVYRAQLGMVRYSI
ncbi:hypothetical protein BHM03_00036657 [Ensete ventricosum]|nr:hypothetical protein BHM03_00036657 [Ensete ventricosum]